MRFVNHLKDVPANALLAEKQVDGRWKVYEPGDTLPPVPSPAELRILTVQEFRTRFTDAELAGIVTSTDTSVKVLMLKLQTRTEVDLNDPQVIAGLDLLLARGLLTAPRRVVIGT